MKFFSMLYFTIFFIIIFSFIMSIISPVVLKTVIRDSGYAFLSLVYIGVAFFSKIVLIPIYFFNKIGWNTGINPDLATTLLLDFISTMFTGFFELLFVGYADVVDLLERELLEFLGKSQSISDTNGLTGIATADSSRVGYNTNCNQFGGIIEIIIDDILEGNVTKVCAG